MAQSNCAAVYVNLVHIKAKLTVNSSSLSSKCLVGLDEVEVGNGQTCTGQSLTGGLDRAYAHDGRVAAYRTPGANLSQRLEAVCLDELLGSDDHSSACIVDAGSVACGNRAAVLLERRAQLAEDLESGVRLYVLIGIEDNGFLLLLNFDRNDLVLEAAVSDSGSSLLLGSESDLVLHLTGDAVLFSYVFSGDAHVILVEYIKYAVVYHHIDHLDVAHASAPAGVAGDVRSTGHGLAAAYQHCLVLTGANDLGAQRDGTHGGSTNLVQGHSRGGDRQTGLQANLTCYVLAYAALQYLTEQNLVDCFLVNACTLDSCLCSSGAKLGGVYIAEGAAVSADCSTGSGTDVNVHLAVSPFLLMRRKNCAAAR